MRCNAHCPGSSDPGRTARPSARSCRIRPQSNRVGARASRRLFQDYLSGGTQLIRPGGRLPGTRGKRSPEGSANGGHRSQGRYQSQLRDGGRSRARKRILTPRFPGTASQREGFRWKQCPDELILLVRSGHERYLGKNGSFPTHNCARDPRLPLYVRDTVYSFPPLVRSRYSPVVQG
jgi:hypothetical protein